MSKEIETLERLIDQVERNTNYNDIYVDKEIIEQTLQAHEQLKQDYEVLEKTNAFINKMAEKQAKELEFYKNLHIGLDFGITDDHAIMIVEIKKDNTATVIYSNTLKGGDEERIDLSELKKLVGEDYE